ncbi:MAG: N-acetyltransferase family protein [Candidatus Binatia bacterium]
MVTALKVAEPADVDLILHLMEEYCAFDHLPFDEQVRRKAIHVFLEAGMLGKLWLILSEGETVGYLVLTLGFSFEYGGYDAFVDEVYLRESHRGKGIGKMALALAEEACHTLHVQALHLEVERENANAYALYRRVGFTEHDRYLMTKIL